MGHQKCRTQTERRSHGRTPAQPEPPQVAHVVLDTCIVQAEGFVFRTSGLRSSLAARLGRLLDWTTQSGQDGQDGQDVRKADRSCDHLVEPASCTTSGAREGAATSAIQR